MSGLRSWRRYTIITALLTGLLLLVSGCGSSDETSDKAPLVKTQVVGQGSGAGENSLAGTIKNRNETALSFQIGGRVIQKNFNIGDRVGAGQVLAILDQGDTRQSVAKCRGCFGSGSVTV